MRTAMLVLALIAFAGCTSYSVSGNWQKVEVGMSDAGVVGLLGKPDSIAGRQQIWAEDQSDGTNLTVEAVLRRTSSAYVARVYKAETRWDYRLQSDVIGRIYFDDEGKVLYFKPREWKLQGYEPGSAYTAPAVE